MSLKKVSVFLAIALLGATIISCNRSEIGKWNDNIKLSVNSIAMDSAQGSFIITTETEGWWLSNVMLNGEYVEESDSFKFEKNFVLANPAFQLERMENGRKIVITMKKNTTNSNRVLNVGLTSGDFFTGFIVTQTK